MQNQQTVSNLIHFSAKNWDGFRVIHNPDTIDIILLPQQLLFSHEKTLIGDFGSNLTIVPELLATDRNLELPLETQMWMQGKKGDALVHHTLEDWKLDMRQILMATPFVLLDSEHIQYPEQRLLVSLKALHKITYRDNEVGEKLRLYFRFNDGMRLFTESVDYDDLKGDVNRISFARGEQWDFSTLDAQASQVLETTMNEAVETVEV